ERGDVAGAAGQVQHAIARRNLCGTDEVALPGTVDAERHQVVHQVVLAGHRREHLADELLLLAGGDFAEAEVGGVARIAGFVHAADYRPRPVVRARRVGPHTRPRRRNAVKPSMLFTAALVPALALAQSTPPPPAPPAAAGTGNAHAMVHAADTQWGPAPPSLPKGARAAVLYGDPGKA